jgi:hypothetical protein
VTWAIPTVAFTVAELLEVAGVPAARWPDPATVDLPDPLLGSRAEEGVEISAEPLSLCTRAGLHGHGPMA